MIEIGHVDITTKVLLLLSHLAYPQEGHLDTALHVISYLRIPHDTRMIFDPSNPNIDYKSFPKCDWIEFYGDVEETIPNDALSPHGKGVEL